MLNNEEYAKLELIEYITLTKLYPFIARLDSLFGVAKGKDFRKEGRELEPFIRDPSLYYLVVGFKYRTDIYAAIAKRSLAEKLTITKEYLEQRVKGSLGGKAPYIFSKEFLGLATPMALFNWREELQLQELREATNTSLSTLNGNCNFAINLLNKMVLQLLRDSNYAVDALMPAIEYAPLWLADLLQGSRACPFSRFKILLDPMLNQLGQIISLKLHTRESSGEVALLEIYRDKSWHKKGSYVPVGTGFTAILGQEIMHGEYEASLQKLILVMLQNGMDPSWLVRLLCKILPSVSPTLYARLLKVTCNLYGLERPKRIRFKKSLSQGSLAKENLILAAVTIIYVSGFEVYQTENNEAEGLLIPIGVEPVALPIAYNLIAATNFLGSSLKDLRFDGEFATLGANLFAGSLGLLLAANKSAELVYVKPKKTAT